MRKGVLYTLGLVIAVLVGLGLVVLFSASQVKGGGSYHDQFYFVKRQGMYLAMGMAIAVMLALVDYRVWRDHWSLTAFFGFVVFVALLAVFFFKPIKGSYRWIALGPFNFQPGEFAKLATVMVLSVWLDLAAWRVELFVRGALWPAVILGAIAGPVVFEPDFGSVMVIASVGFLLMFVAGSKILHILPFGLMGLGVVGWKIFHNANRMARLAAFTGAVGGDPNAAADPAAYQSGQSLIAIARGRIFGVGLSNSMQKQNYLPEAWTDFIFAVGAEEMGLIFSVSVFALFTLFFFLCVHIARKAADRFGRLLVVGMTFMIFFQAVFNIGVVCEAFPTKGMALPFFSYGGTNMLSSFFAIGIIFSVGIHTLRDQKRAFPHKMAGG